MSFAQDTSPEAMRVYFAILRRMGPAGRARKGAELNETMRRILADGIRYRHPGYTEEQVRQAAVRRILGEELCRLASPGKIGSGWKADFILRKDRPFSREEFNRRRPVPTAGRSVWMASPEDVILSKLEWAKITPSERQLRDALGVALVQWSHLDQAYLRHWARELGVEEPLEQLLREAQESPARE